MEAPASATPLAFFDVGPGIAADEEQEIAAFIEAHNERFRNGDLDGVLQCYAEDFRSDAYVSVFDRDVMRRTYEQILRTHSTVHLEPHLVRLDKLGEAAVASVCQDFTGICRDTGKTDRDHWCQLYVLGRQKGELRITRLFEFDHDYLPHITVAGEAYDNPQQMFSLASPGGFLVIRSPCPGGFLHRVRYVDASLEIELSVGLVVNDEREPLEARLRRDQQNLALGASSFKMVGDPAPFTASIPLRGYVMETEFEITTHCDLARRTTCRGPIRLSRMYLTPDNRAIFILSLKGPAARVGGARDQLLATARSLRLTCSVPELYWETLAAANGWGHLASTGHYINASLGLELDLPKGWLGEILPASEPGSSVIQARPADPGRGTLLQWRFSTVQDDTRSLDDLIAGALELPEWAPKLKSESRESVLVPAVGPAVEVRRVFKSYRGDEPVVSTVFFRQGTTFGRVTFRCSNEAEARRLRATLEASLASLRPLDETPR
ncbi:MAG: nuclear transport factor 2 family protein [Planctomycetota bacterium]